jgi:hypothetical protein
MGSHALASGTNVVPFVGTWKLAVMIPYCLPCGVVGGKRDASNAAQATVKEEGTMSTRPANLSCLALYLASKLIFDTVASLLGSTPLTSSPKQFGCDNPH